VAEPDYRRELAGVGLLALALFVVLALVPAALLAPVADRFPSGNLLGVVGAAFHRGAVATLGVGAVSLPVLVGAAGLWIGRWLPGERALRAAVLAVGLLLLLPTFLALFPVDPLWGGWLGGGLAEPLTGGLGGFGAGLLLVVLFILLCMATLGWNPLLAPTRWTFRGAAAGWRGLVGWLENGGGHGREGEVAGVAPPFEPAEAAEGSPPRSEAPASTDPAPTGESEKSRGRGLFGRRRRKDAAVDGELPDPRDPRELEGGELPPLDLLAAPDEGNSRDTERELDHLGEVLVQKLRTFNVESEIGGRTTGPVVTQFEVVPAPGVKVNRIANLDADLALAMRARTIRIVAPIPGKGAVGVEIPNPSPQMVQLREILQSPEFRRSRAELPLALGKDLHGASYVADLAKMPHALIAGATGSGKSVCLNTVITSLVYRHTPATLRLLLIDPKMVELSTYADLPHLRHPVVTDPKDAAGVLKWAVIEMERRYELLSRNGVRSIGEFNRRLRKGVTMRRAEAEGEEGDPDRWIYKGGLLPNIVLIVDELADLMMAVQGEIERPLTLLAQKARAIGIHLIVATQRPSVNVITGLIKANFPCRIAFRVASKTDSRTILDQNGADALLGNGDMLFLPPGQGTPARIQGAFISTEDTERLMGWFREIRERKLEEEEERPGEEEDILEVIRAMEAEEGRSEDDPFDGDWDEYFREAAEICIANDQGSTSLLQRKLRVGYGRAARIVDQLHEAGVVGPPDGSKPREVLMSMDQLDRMFSGDPEG
jgi:DNA segregation ATPase FtsK/SpoIIIE, S-DNA-T family